MSEPRLCGTRTKAGGSCQQPAGRGTDHLGWGHCSFHGGSSPGGRLYAARQEAEQSAIVMGLAVPTDPADGLQLCVDIARAEVDYCSRRIGQLTEQDAVGPLTTKVKRKADEGSYTQTTSGPPAAHIWIKLRAEAMERLTRFSKMAIDADVAERRTRLAEGEAAEHVELYLRVCDAIGATPEQRQIAAATIYRHLQVVDGTAREIAA